MARAEEIGHVAPRNRTISSVPLGHGGPQSLAPPLETKPAEARAGVEEEMSAISIAGGVSVFAIA